MSLSIGIIKRCLEECEKSIYYQRIGAVIFSGKRIISSGHNQIRSSSSISNKYKEYHNSIHAEQAALLNINWNKLKGYSILVMRCSKIDKQLGNSKPCPMCLKILEYVGIKNIYYSNKNGEIVKL